MAIDHIKTIFTLDIPSSHKLVFLAVAQFADEKGEGYPGQKKLSAATSMHIRTVQRSLDWLEANGYLKTTERRRDNGYKTSNLYMITLGGRVSGDFKSGDILSGDTEYDLRRQSVNSQAAHDRDNNITTSRTTREPPESMRSSRVDKFILSESDYLWTIQLGFQESEMQNLIDSFMDYWRGVPGAKGLKLDWPATWRNNARRELGFRNKTKKKDKKNELANQSNQLLEQIRAGRFD